MGIKLNNMELSKNTNCLYCKNQQDGPLCKIRLVQRVNHNYINNCLKFVDEDAVKSKIVLPDKLKDDKEYLLLGFINNYPTRIKRKGIWHEYESKFVVFSNGVQFGVDFYLLVSDITTICKI